METVSPAAVSPARETRRVPEGVWVPERPETRRVRSGTATSMLVETWGLRVEGSGCRVQGSGFRVQGWGLVETTSVRRFEALKDADACAIRTYSTTQPFT